MGVDQPSRAIRTTRLPEACWGSAWCLPRTWGGLIAHDGLTDGRQHALRAISLDDRDPWGHIALGYWAMMERRTEELIAAFRGALNLGPQLRDRPLLYESYPRFCGTGPRGDRPCRDRDQAELPGPRNGPVLWAHRRGALRCRPISRSRPIRVGDVARLRSDFQGVQRLYCASLAQAGRIDEAPGIAGHCATTAAAAVDRMAEGERPLPDARK